MDFKIKFHSVGFGLFTTGKIGNFKFVYDCGSKLTSRANKCVEEEFEEGESLGLIAVSHFHKDHISGLKRLLDRVGHVDTIILPYLTPRERLNYLLTLEQDYPDEWIESFFIDPASSLVELGSENKISKIVFIKGGPNSYEGNVTSNDINPDIPLTELFLDLSRLKPSKDEVEIKSIEEITDSKISIKEHGCVTISAGNNINIWQFIFYYCEQSENIEKYFKDIADCSKFVTDEITKNDLVSIINDVKFSRIAKNHNVSNSDINNTSLLLYHSPIGKCFIVCDDCLKRKLWKRSCIDNNLNNRSGYFYTGDVNLKSKKDEIIKYYGGLFHQVSVFQVPHHGSIDNWDSFLSSSNPEMVHIISSKLNNSRGLHPNSEVLYQITKNQGIIIWCNENREVVLYGNIWYR